MMATNDDNKRYNKDQSLKMLCSLQNYYIFIIIKFAFLLISLSFYCVNVFLFPIIFNLVRMRQRRAKKNNKNTEIGDVLGDKMNEMCVSLIKHDKFGDFFCFHKATGMWNELNDRKMRSGKGLFRQFSVFGSLINISHHLFSPVHPQFHSYSMKHEEVQLNWFDSIKITWDMHSFAVFHQLVDLILDLG